MSASYENGSLFFSDVGIVPPAGGKNLRRLSKGVLFLNPVAITPEAPAWSTLSPSARTPPAHSRAGAFPAHSSARRPQVTARRAKRYRSPTTARCRSPQSCILTYVKASTPYSSDLGIRRRKAQNTHTQPSLRKDAFLLAGRNSRHRLAHSSLVSDLMFLWLELDQTIAVQSIFWCSCLKTLRRHLCKLHTGRAKRRQSCGDIFADGRCWCGWRGVSPSMFTHSLPRGDLRSILSV